MRAILCLTLLAAGCASHGPRELPADSEALHEAGQPFYNCLAAIEPGLDDHRSDAKTIAQALAMSCSEEWARYLTTMRQGQSRSRRDMLNSMQLELRREVALKVVLETRAVQTPPRSTP